TSSRSASSGTRTASISAPLLAIVISFRGATTSRLSRREPRGRGPRKGGEWLEAQIDAAGVTARCAMKDAPARRLQPLPVHVPVPRPSRGDRPCTCSCTFHVPVRGGTPLSVRGGASVPVRGGVKARPKPAPESRWFPPPAAACQTPRPLPLPA